VKYPKVCPDCIEELGFCRFEWSLLPYLACVRHGKLLIDMHSGTGKRLNWYRRYLNKFDDADVIRHEVVARIIRAYQQYDNN
jgi:hypothetical protein